MSDVANFNISPNVDNLGAAYHDAPEHDAEALYRLSGCLSVVRPSVLIRFIGLFDTMERLNRCLMLLEMSAHYPKQAEGFAGEVVDAFPPQQADKADTAYNLVMLAAHDAMQPDGDWQSVSSLTRKIIDGWSAQ